VAALDEIGPHSKSSGGAGSSWGKSPGVHEGWKRKAHENYQPQPPGTYAVDEGGPSRFYPNHDWAYEIAERLAGETPFLYCPKASRGERDAGLGELPEVECQQGCGGDFPVDDQGRDRDRFKVIARNTHACVKPLSLVKQLAALLKPPDEYNPIICVPFSGSGSEVIGAILAGWQNVIAIEREPEYCQIAAARLAWWSKWMQLTGKTDPVEIRTLGEVADAREGWQDDKRQTSIFDLLEKTTLIDVITRDVKNE